MIPRDAAYFAITALALSGGYFAEALTTGAAADPPPRQCFLANRVNGFSPITDTLIDVKVGSDQYYRLTLDGSCQSADFRTRIVLRTLTGGSYICQGLDAEIVVPDAGGAQRCLVRGIQPITKADWVAGSHPKKR